MTAGSTPAKRTPAKKQPAKRAQRGARVAVTPPAGAAVPADPPAPASPADAGLSLNQWLHDVANKPLRIEVFDRWWEFKQPTGGRAERWDELFRTPGKGPRAALASMLVDQAASPERTVQVMVPGPDGQPVQTDVLLEALPGSAGADEFLAELHKQVLPELTGEFWARFERALFLLGEPSAS